MNYGKLYGVGVGPGNPKLMTLLAVETISNCPVIAVPASGRDSAVSYRIAASAVDGIDEKPCIDIETPMTKDRQVLERSYAEAADKIIARLKDGLDVAYLTLGDPTIYATYIYIHRLVKERGYEAEIVSGIPSFCAAAARLGDSLCDRSEQLHIIPSSYDISSAIGLPGNKVLMKAARALGEVKQIVKEKDLSLKAVANCGMENEEVYESADEIPDKGSYFTLMIVKDGSRD